MRISDMAFRGLGLAAFATLAVGTVGCKKDSAPAPVAPEKGDPVKWDPKSEPIDAPEWPMKSEAITPGAATSFAKGNGPMAGPTAPGDLWAKLKPYAGTHLKGWRTQLDGEPGSPVEVVEVFNDLAIKMTGPTGFWRKTLPEQWLGCVHNGETPPCQKVAAMKAELSQWDDISAQLQEIPPEKAQKFVQKNYGRLSTYLETYVPEDTTPDDIKKTPFYQKHLAAALEGQF